MKDYDAPDDNWHYLGETPIESIRVPIGIFRWQMKKEGYETVLAAASTWDLNFSSQNLLIPNNLTRTLDVSGSIPAGMVRVAGAETRHGKVSHFYIDRYEVTNKQFKAFIDSGGYLNKDLWEHEFTINENVLSWQEAIALFVDQTGRAGPSTWIAGGFPEGTADHPVSGISWYEAAAYAKAIGRHLPTGQHWGLARGEDHSIIQYPTQGGFEVLAPFSNFQLQGPVAVGSLTGITSYGAFDMAGNVREWCWNETQQGRLTRGAAWNDNSYLFTELSTAPAFDRSPKNGFRTVLYLDADKLPSSIFGVEQHGESIDYYEEIPVSDEIFEIYKEQFSYDKANLNAIIESRDEGSEHWLHERITIDPAYGNERLIVHLFLPRNAQPPYQTVIYLPGSGSLFQSSSENLDKYFEFPVFLSFIAKNGRAVVYPVYTGTFERRDPAAASHFMGDETYIYSDFLIRVVKDFKRSIDYLETREDIDVQNLAYYGMSWGAMLGAIIPAVEDRLKTSIMLSGGFHDRARPEVHLANYVTRVTLPVLMLNGRYDMLIPYEKSIRPMFDLLGTPDAHKVLKVYDTDHIPPRHEFIKEILAWLDRYLGPVN
jgi:formylglycine-generating enzyme required for sulfatase activity/dienelactone hydrolase